MTRIATGLILLAVLTACGADGEPVRPAVNTSMTVSKSGVSAATGVTLSRGPVSVGVAL